MCDPLCTACCRGQHSSPLDTCPPPCSEKKRHKHHKHKHRREHSRNSRASDVENSSHKCSNDKHRSRQKSKPKERHCSEHSTHKSDKDKYKDKHKERKKTYDPEYYSEKSRYNESKGSRDTAYFCKHCQETRSNNSQSCHEASHKKEKEKKYKEKRKKNKYDTKRMSEKPADDRSSIRSCHCEECIQASQVSLATSVDSDYASSYESEIDSSDDENEHYKTHIIIGGQLYTICQCIRRNGLQADCPFTECQGRSKCLAKPKPKCGPSRAARDLIRQQELLVDIAICREALKPKEYPSLMAVKKSNKCLNKYEIKPKPKNSGKRCNKNNSPKSNCLAKQTTRDGKTISEGENKDDSVSRNQAKENVRSHNPQLTSSDSYQTPNLTEATLHTGSSSDRCCKKYHRPQMQDERIRGDGRDIEKNQRSSRKQCCISKTKIDHGGDRRQEKHINDCCRRLQQIPDPPEFNRSCLHKPRPKSPPVDRNAAINKKINPRVCFSPSSVL